jgi:gentisate 1,2-dioxygenase
MFSGMTRPVGNATPAMAPLLHYHWRDTYPSLQRLARASGNPFDGAALEFVNPATGGPTLATMSCRVQLLRPNEQTKSHRHTSTSIYHAFRGSGTTIINGEKFPWQKGDTFIVPLWSWHDHANASSTDEAILFSMHDEPILKRFRIVSGKKPSPKRSRSHALRKTNRRIRIGAGEIEVAPKLDFC